MDALAEEIGQDKGLTLLHYQRFPGIAPDALSRVEAAIGRPLEEALRAMYAYSNGIQLVWIKHDNPEYSPDLKKTLPKSLDWNFMRHDYHPFDGVIFILPAENTFLNDWQNIIWFAEEANYKTTFQGKSMRVLDFKQRIKPLDMFSKYYSVAIYLNEEMQQNQIIMGQDHEADFQSSKLLSIKEYFDVLISTKGDIKKRTDLLKDKWGALQ